MMKRAKDSTIVAELIRQAFDCMMYKIGDRPLHKGEVLGFRGINHSILLRGNTNLTAYGWAIYSGPMGEYQCDLNHNRYVRGTPHVVSLGFAAQEMLATIPKDEHGLYTIHSCGLGYRAEAVEPPIDDSEDIRMSVELLRFDQNN